MSGPEIREVVRAMMTMATMSESLMSPASRASWPRMMPTAPCAAMPKPSAEDSRLPILESTRAPKYEPETLPMVARMRTRRTEMRSNESMKLMRRPMEAKKIGAKMFMMNWWMVSRVRSRRWWESPMATPATKAPKMECMPRYSVKAAQMSEIEMTNARTPPGQDQRAWT